MPIINPWIFYLIDVLSTLKGVSGFTIFIALSALIFTAVIMVYFKFQEDYYGYEDHAYIKTLIRIFKSFLIIACIATGVYTVTPSEETMYKMLVAQYVTYENVDKATETIKDGVDYIFKKLGKEDKKDE